MSLNDKLLQGDAAAAGGITPSENFKVVTYTGDGTTSQAITGVGFQPDFIWVKERSGVGSGPIADSTRGTGKALYSNLTDADYTFTSGEGIKSFDSDGFTVGDVSNGNAGYNGNGDTYVAWCWKANGGTTSSNTDGNITSTVQVNSDAGFAIAKVTGSGTTDTFGHGLGTTPEVIIRKNLDSTDNWNVYTTVVNGSLDFLRLNTTDVAGDSSYNAPTSTVFTNPGDTDDRIYYSFVSVDGFSKFGTYRGTGSSTDTPIIDTGFEPAFVMTKSINGTTGNWNIYDNARNTTNPRTKYLLANGNNAENSSSADNVSFYSNGFQIGPTTDGNQNGTNNAYFYMAFAADPDTEAPTLASSFNAELYTGTGAARSISGLGFSPGLVWTKDRGNAEQHQLHDIVRGATHALASNLSNAEATRTGGLTSFDSDGFSLGSDGGGVINDSTRGPYVAWTWKADDNEPTIIGGPATLVYKFEDDVTDVTGDYDGTANNITYAAGKFNKAAQFNGSSSYIDTNFTLPAISSYSISFWFNTTSTVTWNDFLADNPSNGAGLGARIILAIKNGTHFHVAISNGSSFWQDNSTVSASNYVDGEWHHYAVAINGTSVKLYVDGYLLHTYTSTVSAGTGGARSITLGRLGDYNGEYFTGKLDQFRFYRGALNYDDATNLWNEKVGDNDDLDYGSPSTTIISANANAGFSIVKYIGNGSTNHQIPHGLSSSPEFVIIKNLNDAEDWQVFGNTIFDRMQLNSDGTDDGNFPLSYSATTITLPQGGQEANNAWNASGDEYVMYCWHSITGYSKIGTYTGVTSGVTVTTGFKPDFLLIKSTSNVEHWAILDTRRGSEKVLNPNRDVAEGDSALNTFTVSSTGFSFPHQDTADAMLNENGYTYSYLAIAKNVPSNTTLANSFKTVTYTGDGASSKSITGVGFQPDFVWLKSRSSGSITHTLFDTLRGAGNELLSADSAAESYGSNRLTSFDTDGFSLGNSGGQNQNAATFVAWAWKAGNTWESNVDGTIPSIVNANTANGFSIVKYIGNGSSGATIGHGLSSAPEMVIVKALESTANSAWSVYHTAVGNTGALVLNTTAATDTNVGYWNNTSPTSTTFTLGTYSVGNESAKNYIAYCFHSVSGYSKFGSYTGNGSTQSITGLGFQPDWVMIKGASSGGAGGWYIFDSVRGAEDYLRANVSNAESTGADATLTSFDSDGFSLGNDGYLNGNTYTYIYAAFKIN